MSDDHFEYVLRLADNALILGQRLGEWCGHGPFLEEDVALANTALDHVGRARMLFSHAGALEGQGRDEDDLAYTRDEREFKNFLICELPIGDFAFTVVRQYLLDVYHLNLFERLQMSLDEGLSGIAAKATKECSYHVRRSRGWVKRLGDGTVESNLRVKTALEELWAYTPELFEADGVEDRMVADGIAPELATIEESWNREVKVTLKLATVDVPIRLWEAAGGREGLHTEHMGRLLAEMQFLQRAYPGLEW